jgi:DNA-binding response OmpR family regulator
MRVLLLADQDPYRGYARPEPSDGGSGLFIFPSSTAASLSPGQEDWELIVLPAALVAAPSWKRPVHPFFAYGSERLMSFAFAAGAMDYLREPWGLEELEARIEGRLAARVFSIKGCRLSLRGRRLSVGSSGLDLGPEEARLLELFLLAPGEILSRELLLEELGLQAGTDSRALDMRISALRKRLSCLGIAAKASVIACRGKGYRLAVDACG